MKRLRLNFLDNLPKVTQLVSGRARMQPSSPDDFRDDALPVGVGS